MHTYPILTPVKGFYYAEFSWLRDAAGAIHLTTEPAAFCASAEREV